MAAALSLELGLLVQQAIDKFAFEPDWLFGTKQLASGQRGVDKLREQAKKRSEEIQHLADAVWVEHPTWLKSDVARQIQKEERQRCADEIHKENPTWYESAVEQQIREDMSGYGFRTICNTIRRP